MGSGDAYNDKMYRLNMDPNDGSLTQTRLDTDLASQNDFSVYLEHGITRQPLHFGFRESDDACDDKRYRLNMLSYNEAL